MTARHKLNSAHFTGSLITAGFLGLVAESWFVFWLVLIAALVMGCHTGDIRLGDHRSRSRR